MKIQQAAIDAERLDRVRTILSSKTVVSKTGCWLWTGYVQPNGYGWINDGKFHAAAHRAALIASGVDVADEMDVCHRCDVRACVNPGHLYAGTRRQNMADCTARNRHNKPQGEQHWRSKLSALDVFAIRAARAAGRTTVAIAADFAVHHATISRIARGIWRTEVSL